MILKPKRIKWFHYRIASSGITVIHEAGLDPGIDHMLAMECIDDIHIRGGKVVALERQANHCSPLRLTHSSRTVAAFPHRIVAMTMRLITSSAGRL